MSQFQLGRRTLSEATATPRDFETAKEHSAMNEERRLRAGTTLTLAREEVGYLEELYEPQINLLSTGSS